MKELSEHFETVIVINYNLLQKSEILISNIFLQLSFFRFRLRPTPDDRLCTQFLEPTSFFPPNNKRAPDLAKFSPYSLFGPLCSVSFFTFCLHDPGALTYISVILYCKLLGSH